LAVLAVRYNTDSVCLMSAIDAYQTVDIID
jgi:hypothetical protein